MTGLIIYLGDGVNIVFMGEAWRGRSWNCIIISLILSKLIYAKVVEWLTRSPANLVKRIPSGAQVRILSLASFAIPFVGVLSAALLHFMSLKHKLT